MSNNKMKGLLKGLRYISQIFDSEKPEPDMQIGFPTDVKHVAHIGWEGPSVNNSPSWMNEFKPPQGLPSVPMGLQDGSSIKGASEDSGGEAAAVQSSMARELPKASRRGRSSAGAADSPVGERPEKADRPKTRRASKPKESSEGRRSYDPNDGVESPSRSLPEIPKTSRRKKSKDSAVGGSGRSRSKPTALETCPSDRESESGSVANSCNGESCPKPFEGAQEKQFT